MNTRSRPQSCFKPSSDSVKNLAHFALLVVAHGSSVKLNSSLSGPNTDGGVAQQRPFPLYRDSFLLLAALLTASPTVISCCYIVVTGARRGAVESRSRLANV